MKICEQARQLHADRTRGQSGHQEGQPDEYALVALLPAVKARADEHLQELTEAFLALVAALVKDGGIQLFGRAEGHGFNAEVGCEEQLRVPGV